MLKCLWFQGVVVKMLINRAFSFFSQLVLVMFALFIIIQACKIL